MGTGATMGRVVAVCIAATAVVALAAAPAVGAEEGFGSIAGRVTGADGRPLGPDDQMCVSYGNATDQRQLNDDGTYLIPRVPVGVWSVTFAPCRMSFESPPRAYAPQMYPDLHDPWVVESAAVPNVAVRQEQTTGGIDARMRDGGRLVVDVVDPDGRPLEGICVSADVKEHPRPADASGAVGWLDTSRSAVTNAAGRAELLGLAPGDRYVRADNCEDLVEHRWLTPSQYLDAFTEEDSETVRMDLGSDSSARVEMSRAGSIRGRVSHDGEPVAGACVTWTPDRPFAGSESVSTDADGRYVLGGLIPTLPGRLRACGERSPFWNHWTETSPAPMWYPDAATLLTSSPLTPEAGAVLPVDFELQDQHSAAVIVRGLDDPTGCTVQVGDSGQSISTSSLRPQTIRGVDVHVATVWGLPGDPTGGALRCDGNRVGVLRPIGVESPFHLNAEQDWESWEIVHDDAGPRVTTVGPASTGWSRRPVTVRFECADDGVGVETCPAPVVLGEGRTTTVTATDRDGNSTTTRVGPMRVDQTPPRWRIGEGRRTFRLGERLDLRCSMVDDRSGLAWSSVNCPAAGTSTDRLGVGTHEFHLMGQDRAGNSSGAILRISVVK